MDPSLYWRTVCVALKPMLLNRSVNGSSCLTWPCKTRPKRAAKIVNVFFILVFGLT